MLFPWSSQARGFFIKKKEIMSNEHFSNPTLDEEIRVWHHEKNLQRRQVCFDMAKERNVQPIQITHCKSDVTGFLGESRETTRNPSNDG